jgi:DNA-binding HxlR family transcriptional regulator
LAEFMFLIKLQCKVDQVARIVRDSWTLLIVSARFSRSSFVSSLRKASRHIIKSLMNWSLTIAQRKF